MSNSINTNIAAYFAQANIAAASNASSSSVARLSSGNRIVQASDDVAALAIGTSLGTQVSGLKTALTNASQGSSLLQVADGALAQIQSILQQQQSIANQAQSGSLTDTERGFLNQQFQALSSQIDSLAAGTTFNGVNLLDGSIATAGTVGSTNPLVNTSADTTTTTALASIGSATFAGAQTANALLGQGVAHYAFTGTGNAANQFSAAAVTAPTAGNASGNDSTLSTTALAAATVTATANGTIDPTGQNVGSPTATAYTVNVTIGGVQYSGSLALAATGDPLNTAGAAAHPDGSVSAGTQLVLTATSGANAHGTITLTVGTAGFTGASHADGDLSAAVSTALQTQIRAGSETTGALGTVAIAHASASATTYDTALQGDLSQGSFNVFASSTTPTTAGTVGTGGSASGYTIQYTLNGVNYQGVLATSSTGSGTTTGASVVLTATSDPTLHSTITVNVGTQFGTGDATTDQSNNIKDALKTQFANANLTSSAASAVISGTTATGGINSVVASDNVSKNDTYLVGDLSKGSINVTGSNASGFTVSYSINGSTYQGFLSSHKATAGGNLILSNGTGSLNFTIGAAASATASDAATLKSALTSFFTSTTDGVTTGATAYAVHSVATTLAKDTSGVNIANSGIPASASTGTVIEGFNGANVKLQSATFTGGDTQLSPLATFSATGSGTSTVFSVIIDGTKYSTGATAPAMNAGNTGDELKLASFDIAGSVVGNPGVVTFYKNGDDTSSDKLTLDLSNISAAANVSTTADVNNVVAALNTAFGSGGSKGGLNFQLGTSSSSNVAVNIDSAKTTALFGATTLDVSTATTAATAALTVGKALDTITAIRSGVGALETRFNFASSALQSSVQNQSAAQSGLLDTDIASESTNFATQQVKLQAGISVLAQANQQLQALLKLIG